MSSTIKIKLLTFLVVALGATQANALPISGGEVFNINWFVDLDDSRTSSDLSATSSWEVTSYSSTSITLDIEISNTTSLDPGILTEAALVSFGFGIEPDAVASFLSAGSTFDLIGDGSGSPQNFPGGYSGIDVCIFSQGCSGGSVNEGLQAGASDSFQILLSGTFGDSVDLLFFPAKFQTTIGSYEPAGMTAVPEPSVLALFGVGLLGLGVVGRRRKQAID